MQQQQRISDINFSLASQYIASAASAIRMFASSAAKIASFLCFAHRSGFGFSCGLQMQQEFTMSNFLSLRRPRPDHKGLITWLSLVLVTLCYLSGVAHAQNARWDIGSPGSAGVVTFSGSGLAFLVAQGNVTLAWCNYPANSAPCTNYANTYPSFTSASACPTNAQVVLQGSSTCQATSDNFGNLGVYTPNGLYAYTLTVNGVAYGPYSATVGVSGAGAPNGSLQANDNGAFAGVPNSSVNFTSGNITTTAGISAGTLNATTTSSAAQFLSNSSNPATAGAVALANSDCIDWRNNANNANEGFCVTSADIGTASFAGGFGLIGTTAKLWFGGFTSSFPMLKPVGSGLQMRLGNDSGYAAFSAATSSGPSTSTPAAPASGGIGYFKTGTGWCSEDSGGTEYCAQGFAPQRVVLAAPVTPSGGVQTIILTETVTFPSPAGTYRALVSYGLNASVSANACGAEVIDTTNSKAYALSAQDANGSGYIALSGSELSYFTYAAGATPTFTLQIICNAYGGGGVSINSGIFSWSPAEPTYLSVTPVLSQ